MVPYQQNVDFRGRSCLAASEKEEDLRAFAGEEEGVHGEELAEGTDADNGSDDGIDAEHV